MQIYIIHEEVCYDYETEHRIKPYRDKAKAISDFEELVRHHTKNAEEDNWEINSNTDLFEAYDDGCYNENHIIVNFLEYTI